MYITGVGKLIVKYKRIVYNIFSVIISIANLVIFFVTLFYIERELLKMGTLIKKIDFTKKKNIYICLGILATIFLIPFLIPHFALDSYPLLSSGYHDYAIIFIKSNRIISALFYEIFNFICLPYNTLSIVSTLVSGLLLVISAITFGNMVINNRAKIQEKNYIMIYIISFLCFFNFLNMELFVFMESFVMCLGIFLIVKSIENFTSYKKHKYWYSILYLITSMYCYQGIICLFIPLCLIIIYLKYINNDNINYKQMLKEMLLLGVFYATVLLITYFSIFVISYLFNIIETKTIGINIFKNISITINLFKDTMHNLYGLFSTKIFYLTIFILFIVYIFVKLNINDDNKIIKIGYLIFTITVCIILPFIPNLVMSTKANYSAARMSSSIGLIIPIIMFFIIFDYNKINIKTVKYILQLVIMMFLIYTGYQYNNNLQLSISTYRQDREEMNLIYEEIVVYEKKQNIKIKDIYFGKDPSVNYYYHSNKGNYNGFNLRLMAIDWAIPSAFNGFNKSNYKFILLDEKTIQDKFNNINYDKFDEKQLIFFNDKVYLYLY
ncbi:MAG: glucosyltransferase domain-containing protein [Bacilli bacterium]